MNKKEKSALKKVQKDWTYPKRGNYYLDKPIILIFGTVKGFSSKK